MNVYIDAGVFVRWEKGEFDLPGWIEARDYEFAMLPATVWQQLLYGAFAWEPSRAAKRQRTLIRLNAPVVSFSRKHASRAAQIAAELKTSGIGFSDCQIAASAIEDNAELLSFNLAHFSRVKDLRLAKA